MLIEHYLLILTGIIVPLVGIYLRWSRRTAPKKHENVELINLQNRIEKLEDSSVRNQIEIEDARRDMAYIKGRLNI